MEYSTVQYRYNSIPNDVYVTVSNILHDAFEERIRQGIDFKCGHFTPDDLKSDLLGESYLFVAFDDKGKPVGTVSLKIRQKKGYVYGGFENLAVVNAYKGKGVATILTDELIKKSNHLKLDFITSSTACNARSSVSFHLKKGFLIYMKSYGKKYDSYNFILPLKKLRILRIGILRKLIYWAATAIFKIKKQKK